MSAIKAYFKEQVKPVMCTLEHPKYSDFYLSCWQTTSSAVPLLICRVLLFLSTLAILLASITYYIRYGVFGYWFIYLTHWGLMSILLTTGFGVAVSTHIYIYGPISRKLTLPWYVKVYWVLFNIAVPVAFLITSFYWAALYKADASEEMEQGVNVAVHGLNSLLVLIMLFSVSHPSRLCHIIQPLSFAFVYTIFGICYHFAGGRNKNGKPYVYTVINWSNPGTTILVVIVTFLILMLLHLVTVGLALARDKLSSRFMKKYIEE